ncbi:MAG: arabinofuranan 3-O-arabinosyltransferase, partial [Mycobacterium sp.]|nr:arabinofuranan 3-O-arabinosyltransferase [Mycobacterium sp.]
VTSTVAMLAIGAVISGVVGVVVVGAATGIRYLLRTREKLCDAVTVGASATGLILAGAVLSQHPWRSVDGYVGHSAGVQLLALISLAAVAASVVPVVSPRNAPPRSPAT